MKVGEQVARALVAGFDLTSDFRLLFAKLRWRRVDLDEARARDILVLGSGSAALRGVPHDVDIDKGERIRFCCDILEFNQQMDWGFWGLGLVAPCLFSSILLLLDRSFVIENTTRKIGGYKLYQS